MHSKITNQQNLICFLQKCEHTFLLRACFQLRHFKPWYRGKVLNIRLVIKWKTTEATNPWIWQSPTGNITWVTETSTLQLLIMSAWFRSLFLSAELDKYNNTSSENLFPSVSLHSVAVCFIPQQGIDPSQGLLWGSRKGATFPLLWNVSTMSDQKWLTIPDFAQLGVLTSKSNSLLTMQR